MNVWRIDNPILRILTAWFVVLVVVPVVLVYYTVVLGSVSVIYLAFTRNFTLWDEWTAGYREFFTRETFRDVARALTSVRKL